MQKIERNREPNSWNENWNILEWTLRRCVRRESRSDSPRVTSRVAIVANMVSPAGILDRIDGRPRRIHQGREVARERVRWIMGSRSSDLESSWIPTYASFAVSFMLDSISSLCCLSTIVSLTISLDASPFLDNKVGTWCAAKERDIRIAKHQWHELGSSVSTFDWSLGSIRIGTVLLH